MADNMVFHDANGANVTIRSKDPGSGIQTEQAGNEAGSQVDGHSVTLGSIADARWSGSGNATLVAALKDLALQLRAAAIIEDVPHVSGDTGRLMLAVRADTAGTLSSTTGDNTPLQCDDQGQLRVAAGQIVAQTSTSTRIPAAAGSVTMLASNTARIGATLQNDSSSLCYVYLGSGASSIVFSAKLAPNDPNGIGGYYEVPYSYSGIITAAWAVATGAIQVVELT